MDAVDAQSYEGPNLSFTAKLLKRKPLIFLEKVGGLCFFASKKWPHGTSMGLARYFGAKNPIDLWQSSDMPGVWQAFISQTCVGVI